jgi:chemotaxis family two-component system sensor kinase Cph1
MEQEEKRGTTPHTHHDQCALEKIHVIGCIQPHGMLFAMSEPDLVVRYVSANVSDLLGLRAEDVLGQSFQKVIGTEQVAALQSAVKGNDAFVAILVRVAMRSGSRELPCVVHRRGGMLIVEFELALENRTKTLHDIDMHVRLPLLHLESAKDIAELAHVAADEIKRLSGFDRVMIYRFDDHWNGEVIAEVSSSSAVSYQGLRFPATDIPPQARQLFVVNALRTIEDVDAETVQIIPNVNPVTGIRLDLTHSLLRSASPIHLEYLRNMDVRSSMTVSIIVEGKLWGMIACHHPRPHAVDRSTRSLAVLIAQNCASQVTLRIDNAALQRRVESRDALERYLTEIKGSEDSLGVHLHSPRVLNLFDADGLISRIDGVVACNGVTAEYDSLLPTIARLRALATRGIASSQALGGMEMSPAFNTSRASGALYVDLGEANGDFLLFLRRELVNTVVWAGNPHEAVSVDTQDRLHPRASFAAWRETVRGLSRGWTTIELENARYLREQLLRLRDARQLVAANQALVREIAERKRAQADLLMAQKLESVGRLAAGVAHEINTPVQFVSDNVQFVRTSMTAIVGVIQAFRGLQHAAQSGADVAAAAQAVAVAETAADLDYILEEAPRAIDSSSDGLERIATIVRSMKELAHPDQAHKTSADLNRAIESTLLVARSEYKYVADVQTDFGVLPPILCYLGEINQVVLNLLLNAAYAVSDAVKDTGQRGTLTVRTRLDGDEVEISIGDTGTGIPEGVRDKIFDPFFTTKEVGKGTGQGLAIAYSVVVKKHGGSLRFETECGKGTTFFIRLPVNGRIEDVDIMPNAA